MKKILYLVANDAYFLSHRRPVALAALKAGYQVTVVAKDTGHREIIEKDGCRFVPLTKLDRGGLNPFKDLAALKEIIKVYKTERPDLVHHVAMKPVLYGSLAAWWVKIPAVINALTGLGYLFISQTLKAKAIRAGVMGLFKWLFGQKGFCLLVQNQDDLRFFKEKIPKARVEIIKGSGVDTKKFVLAKTVPSGPIHIALVARMLWDKGVKEAVDAMRLLKTQGLKVDLYLYGDPDPENPQSIPPSQLLSWMQQGLCKWQGHTKDIASVYHQSHIALLPSYREGLPKSLLEAAACGLPIVATDVPGCREVVQDGQNGYLVPLKNSDRLAERLAELIADPALRRRMGKTSRKRAEKEFSTPLICEQTLDLYKSLF